MAMPGSRGRHKDPGVLLVVHSGVEAGASGVRRRWLHQALPAAAATTRQHASKEDSPRWRAAAKADGISHVLGKVRPPAQLGTMPSNICTIEAVLDDVANSLPGRPVPEQPLRPQRGLDAMEGCSAGLRALNPEDPANLSEWQGIDEAL
eukprot:CAMPEP_0168430450 /NCGR_PEP_ID=MMETSP0228-20121227/37886_1 /TAXON_ID=133427 /ORGANISM="Protoceratium reticulatum, Strain CCCM 535 (=CCMP 1889)" /LENGTH=148 /DNA_ID=CAMNT_0008444555 /DNA_START=61 /DNA_END=505 /DNA_ORIENTATION=+